MRSFLIFNFIKHTDSSFRMTLISHEYGCRFPHSRTYLISTTHSSLISSSILILWHRICPRLPRMPSTFWCLGTLQADASLRTARRFPESLADYNLESILCSFGRYSYHYPPQMILAENQLWSFSQLYEIAQNENRHYRRAFGNISLFLR